MFLIHRTVGDLIYSCIVSGSVTYQVTIEHVCTVSDRCLRTSVGTSQLEQNVPPQRQQRCSLAQKLCLKELFPRQLLVRVRKTVLWRAYRLSWQTRNCCFIPTNSAITFHWIKFSSKFEIGNRVLSNHRDSAWHAVPSRREFTVLMPTMYVDRNCM